MTAEQAVATMHAGVIVNRSGLLREMAVPGAKKAVAARTALDRSDG